MIPQVNSMLEQIVMVSPRLALAHTQHTAEEWARVLTAMHHFDPARTIPLITWRRSHQRPHIFAAPDRLQTQANAERLEMMDRERRPSPLRRINCWQHWSRKWGKPWAGLWSMVAKKWAWNHPSSGHDETPRVHGRVQW